jgi:hypothetical protein
MLSIVSDADNGVQKVTLTGIGNDPNSVFDSPFGVLELSNYPNPASGMTTIDFVLPESSPIVLNIFDAHGRFVGAIYNSQGSLGKNSVSFSTENLSIGTYFIEMLYKGQRFTHMMTIAR